MRKIIIYKDKITTMEWHEQERTWVEHDIAKLEGSIIKYLNRLVEIKPDVTVYDFMKHLETYEATVDYFFQDFTRGVSLRPFLEEMEKDGEDAGLGNIELIWEGEIIENSMSILGYLRTWLSDEKIKEMGEEFDIPQEINFLPLNTWKNCLLMLNENIVIVDSGTMQELKSDLVFSGFYSWTLFEVISNFLGELTLNGGPEDRDKLYSQMENKKYDLKEVIKSKEKSDFWLLFLSAELFELNIALDRALEEEEYEKVANLKKEIESVEDELETLKTELNKTPIK